MIENLEWSYEQEWYEETNVARRIRDFLQDKGYRILRFSENKRQKGPDIVAEKGGERVVIEVKGYPSRRYVRGEKKGKPKPTPPQLQATHWFCEALFQVIREKSKNKTINIGIGLPKFPKYLQLIKEVSILSSLNLRFYLVDENGKVEVIKLTP